MVDSLLLLGFGGPTPGCCGRRPTCSKAPGCEAECFVSGILGDNPARAKRIAEVTGHYLHFGGYSPYNELTARQGAALGAELARRGRPLRVACGYRHWVPWTSDGLRELQQAGARETLLLIMAPHQSSVSWDWYIKHAAEAIEQLGEGCPRVVGVIDPWWNKAGYIEAIADTLREATRGWTPERVRAAALVFTAHAIPQPVESTSPYRTQFAESARLAAAAFGHPEHAIAFQSQPGDSRIPWSAPTIEQAVEDAHRAGHRDVIVQAAGFLVDHTEVLYDLDVEAKELAERLGIGFHRARCVHDHPAFIAMLADQVERALPPAAVAQG
ncbi:MAG: ferrochelatase [Planctomycetes bacterium]|nr:ferrochelatase [Planctomycetota bacterium]